MICNPNNYIVKSFYRSDRLAGRGFFGFSILYDRGSNFSPANFYIIKAKTLGAEFQTLINENFATESPRFRKNI